MAKTNPKKKTSNLTKYNRAGYFFVAPFVIVFLIFSVYPVFRTLVLSFTDSKLAGMPYHFVGLKNYTRVFTDKFFWRALWNTIRIWGVNIVLQLGLAFLLTVVFSDIKYKFKGLPVFRALYYLPNLIAATSVAFLFKTLLDWRYGTFNQILNSVYRSEQGAGRLAWKFRHHRKRHRSHQCMDVVWQLLHYADGRRAGNQQRLL